MYILMFWKDGTALFLDENKRLQMPFKSYGEAYHEAQRMLYTMGKIDATSVTISNMNTYEFYEHPISKLGGKGGNAKDYIPEKYYILL